MIGRIITRGGIAASNVCLQALSPPFPSLSSLFFPKQRACSQAIFDKDVPLHCNFDLLLIFSDCFFIQRFITFQHLQSVYHPVTGGNLLCCNHLIALCFSFFFWDSGQKSNYLPVCLGCQRKIGVSNVPTIVGKSLGVYTFAFLGHFPIYTCPTPPLTSLTPLDMCTSGFFSKSWLCIGWGEGELQENFIKVALYYEGTQKLQKIMNTALLSEGL